MPEARDLHSLFEEELRDIYDAEKQIILQGFEDERIAREDLELLAKRNLDQLKRLTEWWRGQTARPVERVQLRPNQFR